MLQASQMKPNAGGGTISVCLCVVIMGGFELIQIQFIINLLYYFVQTDTFKTDLSKKREEMF